MHLKPAVNPLTSLLCLSMHVIPAGLNNTGNIVCLFLARMCIFAAFNVLWLMTPEYYPTSVRNFGLGLTNAFGR